MKKFFTAVATFLMICSAQGLAQANSAIVTINPEQGTGLTEKPYMVEVWAGRATAIDFSQIKERIVQVFLADPSRLTFTTDAPLDKGVASTLFLRQIQKLNFTGQTTTKVTNLFIKTKNEKGEVKLYTFNVSPSQGTPRYSGISIAPISQQFSDIKIQNLPILARIDKTINTAASINNNTVITAAKEFLSDEPLVRRRTIYDIEKGLSVAISRRYTSKDDPIVKKVRYFLSRARTTDYSLVTIADSLNIYLPVLVQLNSLGKESLVQEISAQVDKQPHSIQQNKNKTLAIDK